MAVGQQEGKALTTLTALCAAAEATTELHIDIEGEDCWIKVDNTATTEEVLAAYARAEAAGLEEEEESIEYHDDYTGWTAHFRFSAELMKERGMS